MMRPEPMDQVESEPEPMLLPPKPSWTRVGGIDLGEARATRATAAQALARTSSISEREARAAFEQQRQASEREMAATEAELQRVQRELSSLVSPVQRSTSSVLRAEVDPRTLAAVTGARDSGQVVSGARHRERVLTLRGSQSGWMWKMAGGARLGNPWQKRWFILESNKLTYYDNELRGTLKGTVDLSVCTAVQATTPDYVDDVERRYEFEVELPKRTYRFRCENAENFEHWLRALRKGREDPRLLTALAPKCGIRSDVWLADARDASRRVPVRALAKMVATQSSMLDELGVWLEGMSEWIPLRNIVDQQVVPTTAALSGGGFVKVTSDRLGARSELAIELKILQELARRGADVNQPVQPEGVTVHLSAAAAVEVVSVAGKLLAGEVQADCCVRVEGMDQVNRHRAPTVLDIDRLGEELANSVDRYVRTEVPIRLHVYDLAHSRALSGLNTRALGAYHVAVEVYGYEWSFGWNDDEETGVFACEPKQCEMHTYRESLSMGTTTLSRDQVNSLLDKLEPTWLGDSYDITSKNCCHFSNQFCVGLGVGEIPKWMYRLADAGAAVEGAGNAVAGAYSSLKARWERMGTGSSPSATE